MPHLLRSKDSFTPAVLYLACAASFGWTSTLGAQEVQQATHTAALTPGFEQSQAIRFRQQEAKVGDRVTQQVAMDLSLQGSIIQAGQVAGSQDASMRRGQERLVEVLEVADGRVSKAKVSFPHSRQQMPECDDGKEVIQPVEGKTYVLTRTGERLIVNYTDGTLPPADEFEIVLNSLQSLGKPNPLAAFLLDRDFQIGQTIELPQSLAQQMLGFGSELGEVTKFQLTLREVKKVAGASCAVFDSNIQVGGMSRSPISLQATGNVVIRLDTCRTVLADFSGPLKMRSLHTTPEGSFQQEAEGSLRVAIRSNYVQ